MFDLNLVNKSGFQIVQKKVDETEFVNEELSKKTTNDFPEMKSYKPWYVVVLVVCLLFILYTFFLFNNSTRSLFIEKYEVDVSQIFNIINEPNSNIEIEKLNFSNDKFNFKIKTLNKNLFYNIMDDMSLLFGSNVMGVNINNIYTINMNLINQNYNESRIAINQLSKELSDFNINIKKEIYNDKLILVLDKVDMFIVVDFLIKLNLINSYNLNIELIQNTFDNIELYQMIIK